MATKLRNGLGSTRTKGVKYHRRKYRHGTCQDCGYEKNITTIVFWVNGMKYNVCSQCIKPYRDTILTPPRKV